MLRQLAVYHSRDPSNLFVVRLAQGLTHLGKGTLTLSPWHSERFLSRPVGVAGLLTLLVSCLDMRTTFMARHDYLIFYLTPAIQPRLLMTFDQELKQLPVTVRVGQAVDVVGQAGRPKTITGFQTHTTPVLLSYGERAELATDEYMAVTQLPLEGFVILTKNPDYEESTTWSFRKLFVVKRQVSMHIEWPLKVIKFATWSPFCDTKFELCFALGLVFFCDSAMHQICVTWSCLLMSYGNPKCPSTVGIQLANSAVRALIRPCKWIENRLLFKPPHTESFGLLVFFITLWVVIFVGSVGYPRWTLFGVLNLGVSLIANVTYMEQYTQQNRLNRNACVVPQALVRMMSDGHRLMYDNYLHQFLSRQQYISCSVEIRLTNLQMCIQMVCSILGFLLRWYLEL